MTSVDGKILSDKWGKKPEIRKLLSNFEAAHEKMGVKSWIVGRTTMEKDFTFGAKPMFRKVNRKLDRNDFVANARANSFAIAIDGQGKLGWRKPMMLGDHVISILTEGVKDGYLAHLREIGVSYIFAGKKNVDIGLALEKLYSLFGIKVLMLEGGGGINGSFLNGGFIDEFNQLLIPVADGTIETTSVFEIDKKVKKSGATLLKLKEFKRLKNDVLWLKYKIAKPS
jgi:riboflavin biosynthesis pyrimidine reductase